MAVQFEDDLDLNSNGITSLVDPTNDQDAATKKYVDDEVAAVDAAALSDTTPEALGSAAAGDGTAASRDDHVHPTTGLITSAAHTQAAHNALNIDAATLGGDSKATIISAAVSAVVDSAPSALDTLNELAAALGDDANFASTVTNALADRVQTYAESIGDGSTTDIVVTHNIGTRDVQVQVYEVASPYSQVWTTVERTSTSTVTLKFGSAPSTDEFRVVVQGRAD